MKDKDTQLLTEAYRDAAVQRYLIKEGFPGKDKIKNWILGKLDGFKQWLDSEEGQQILKQRGLLKEDFVLQEGMKDWLGLLGIGGIAAALAYYLKMDPDALQSVLDFFPDLLDQITNLFGGGEAEGLSPPTPMDSGESDMLSWAERHGIPPENMIRFDDLSRIMQEHGYNAETATEWWDKLESVNPDLGERVTRIINKGSPEQVNEVFEWMEKVDKTSGGWDAITQQGQNAANAATKAAHAADAAPTDPGTSSVLQRPGSWLPGGEKAYLGSRPGPGE